MIDKYYILKKLSVLFKYNNRFLKQKEEINFFFSIKKRSQLIEGTKLRLQSSLKINSMEDYKVAELKLKGLEDCQTKKVIYFILFSKSEIMYIYTSYNMEQLIFSSLKNCNPIPNIFISEYKIWLKEIHDKKIEIPQVMQNISENLDSTQ